MTRFVYLVDTHVGAAPMEFQMQQGYPERLPELLDALSEWMVIRGDVDFVLHGGDLVDRASDANIARAAELFRLDVPMYLCLGNHDVTRPDSVDAWRDAAPEFFPDGSPSYAIETGDCVVHVLPNQWQQTPYSWQDKQDPHFLGEQVAQLATGIATRPDATHLLATHSPVFGLPPEQTGKANPFHAPPQSFTTQVVDLMKQFPQVRCVLGAHNHMNMHVEEGGVDYVTVSAFVETPFEFKLFEVDGDSIAMSTVNLADRLDWRGEYNQDRAFVQGRPVDRGFARKVK